MSATSGNSCPPEKGLDGVLPAVNALARSRDPERVSWKATRNGLLEAAGLLRVEAGETKPPINPYAIARLRKIWRTEHFRDTQAPEAVLVPTPKGFIVRLHLQSSYVRNRANLAHEIGHTFFYDLRAVPPTRLVAWGTSGTLSRKEEGVCWAFARELLMPRELVTEEQKTLHGSSSMELLAALADRFKVSPRLAVFRMLWDLSALNTTVAVFDEIDRSGRHRGISRYYGQLVRDKLRKKEREILDSVSKTIEGGPPFCNLDEIARQNASIADLQWKVTAGEDYQNVIALICCQR